MDDLNADEDLIDPDERRPRARLDTRVQNDAELSDSDDEGEGGRRDHASHRDRDRDLDLDLDREGSPGSSLSVPLNGVGRRPSGGIGIMGGAPSMAGLGLGSTNGAGPSGHSHVVPTHRPSPSPPLSDGSVGAAGPMIVDAELEEGARPGTGA